MPQVTGDTLRPGGLELTARALEHSGLPPGARIVDIGCGLGATLAFLRSCGFTPTGVESSPIMLARVRAAHPGLDVRLGFAEALPLEDGAVDAAIMECTLSLVADRPAALREIYRVVRPGGRLLLSDMYRRRPTAGAPGGRRTGCLGGVGSEGDVRALLRAGGFDLALWEDESDALAALAAAIVFAHGSLETFFAFVGFDGAPACDAGGAGGLGYFLAIATRDDVACVRPAPAADRRTAAPPRSRHDGG